MDTKIIHFEGRRYPVVRETDTTFVVTEPWEEMEGDTREIKKELAIVVSDATKSFENKLPELINEFNELLYNADKEQRRELFRVVNGWQHDLMVRMMFTSLSEKETEASTINQETARLLANAFKIPAEFLGLPTQKKKESIDDE